MKGKTRRGSTSGARGEEDGVNDNGVRKSREGLVSVGKRKHGRGM